MRAYSNMPTHVRPICEGCGRRRDDVEYCKQADAYFCDECYTDFCDGQIDSRDQDYEGDLLE